MVTRRSFFKRVAGGVGGAIVAVLFSGRKDASPHPEWRNWHTGASRPVTAAEERRVRELIKRHDWNPPKRQGEMVYWSKHCNAESYELEFADGERA